MTLEFVKVNDGSTAWQWGARGYEIGRLTLQPSSGRWRVSVRPGPMAREVVCEWTRFRALHGRTFRTPGRAMCELEDRNKA